MAVKKNYALRVFTIEEDEHPHKKVGYRWELRGTHYSCYSENIFKDKCSAVTSANNFCTNHSFGVKSTTFPGRSNVEVKR